MALKCGIVGLSNVGKTTLFNSLSNAKAQSTNFPFSTVEPNMGTITVPDERLYKISEMVKPEKTIPTTVEIVDIAGLVKGASKGEGLGNKFLATIRETNAIIHVLRCFDDDNIIHVSNSVNPVRDKEDIDLELQIKDIENIDNRLKKIDKQAKTGDKAAKRLCDILHVYKNHLEDGKLARTAPLDDSDKELTKDLFLLTAKPVLYVCNVDEASILSGNKYVDAVREAVKDEDAEVLVIAALTESEIASLGSYEEKKEYLEMLGLKEAGVNRLIKSAYRLLKLETYFTEGPKEVRAWTISRGMKAPQAAGVIHSDFERGFIRAVVIKYEDFIKYGSENGCKEAGKVRIEGKDYIVQDGDMMRFRFNV